MDADRLACGDHLEGAGRESEEPPSPSRRGANRLRVGNSRRSLLGSQPRQPEGDSLGISRAPVDLSDAARAKPLDESIHEKVGGRCPGRDSEPTVTPSSQRSSSCPLVVEQVRRDPARSGHVDEAIRIRAVRGAEYEKNVDLVSEVLHAPAGSSSRSRCRLGAASRSPETGDAERP